MSTLCLPVAQVNLRLNCILCLYHVHGALIATMMWNMYDKLRVKILSCLTYKC